MLVVCDQDMQRRTRISAWISTIGFSLLLVSLPARAQNADPFQSAPVVATPAPKPRPQPRSPVEPDPYVAIPPAALAPTLPPVASLPPSGVIWARVRQVAQTDGISVPLASDPPFDASTASPQLRILVGAWGPGAWQGSPVGDKLILIVLGVDGGASVRGVVARSLGTDWSYFSAPVTGNGFSVHIQTTYEASGRFNTTRALEDDYWQFELRGDGRLYGSRSTSASNIVLAKLQ
ncbi:MAG: hypothetical protein ACHQZS_13445 [Candidatus Binatales bacterium]